MLNLQTIRSTEDFKNVLLRMENIRIMADCFLGLAQQGLKDLKSEQLTAHLNRVMKLCQTDLGLGQERCQQLLSEFFHDNKTISPIPVMDLDTLKWNTISLEVMAELVSQQMQQVWAQLPSLKFQPNGNLLEVRLNAADHWEKEIQKVENQLLALKTNLLKFAENTEAFWDWIQTHFWKPIQQAQQA